MRTPNNPETAIQRGIRSLVAGAGFRDQAVDLGAIFNRGQCAACQNGTAGGKEAGDERNSCPN